MVLVVVSVFDQSCAAPVSSLVDGEGKSIKAKTMYSEQKCLHNSHGAELKDSVTFIKFNIFNKLN